MNLRCDNCMATLYRSGRTGWKEYSFERFQLQTVRTCSEQYGRLGHTYFTRHEETIKENIMLFKEFVCLLNSRGVKTYVVVPPVNIAMLDDESKLAFESQKQIFYTATNDCKNVEMVDCAEIFITKPDMFYDIDHLNYNGAVEFTRYINENVLRDN